MRFSEESLTISIFLSSIFRPDNQHTPGFQREGIEMMHRYRSRGRTRKAFLSALTATHWLIAALMTAACDERQLEPLDEPIIALPPHGFPARTISRATLALTMKAVNGPVFTQKVRVIGEGTIRRCEPVVDCVHRRPAIAAIAAHGFR